MKLTEAARRAKAAAIFEECEELMTYLAGRWLAEKEFEDINDYGVGLKEIVEKKGGTFLKMTKKPFGFTYSMPETEVNKVTEFHVFIKGKTCYTWKRTK